MGKEKKISVVVDIRRSLSTNESWFAAGGSWVINHDLTVVKARLDNSGTLRTLLQHNIKDQKSWLLVSSEFDVKSLDKKPRIGLTIILMPLSTFL